MGASVQDGIIEIACESAEHVSLAYHENAISVLWEIFIWNAPEDDVRSVEFKIESRPPVVHPLTLLIDHVPAGGTHHIATLNIRLDAG